MNDSETILRIHAKKGILYGLLGTLLMSVVMLIGMRTGISPIPEPIPLAIAGGLLGSVAKPILMGFAVITHFGYGAFWGGVLFYLVKDRGNVWHGLGMGIFLWLIMEFIVLPLLGWGFFGTAVTPKIAVATLVLHLIYGGTLGWGLTRLTSESTESEEA